ncbi:lipoprotein [Rhizocola hellebori]|uniref:Lipoprotein n=1 Tax=Rhizocola hellebori TaxID=1392758 RepID=A0A8J3Q3Z5_9ACTN|nr:ABC transporter substrate-binding protein [Rhizocola hellebori]GIH03019.1 lipoprotein [Rhizocola hellebori]
MRRVAALLVAVAALAGCRTQSPAPSDTTIKSDVGVTSQACPAAVDPKKGCIYLGVLSDLTGPVAALGVTAAEGVKGFWKRVNANGGIAGKYEVDATSYVKDSKYDPQTHNQAYQEIKSKVLALGLTFGSPTTAAILPDMKSNNVIAVPGAFSSGFLFEDVMLETAANYCVESMNDVDYAKETWSAKSAMAVHWPGDYGDDSAFGVKFAAEKAGLTFTDVVTGQGQDKQAAAVAAIVAGKPDVVILAVGPTENAAIVGGAAAQGFKGRFIGLGPTWVAQLNASPAAPALAALYLQSGGLAPWNANSPGHQAMRETLGKPASINDGLTTGWASSYPLKAALEKAVANGDLTRAGFAAAAKSLTRVDFEDMLPPESGNYAGGPATAPKNTGISKPDKSAATGITLVKEMFTGPTAKAFTPTKPCYVK